MVSPLVVDYMVEGPPQGQWTVADWEKLPEDGYRYEVIDGWLYMTTAPSNFHQWIVQQLIELLGIPAKQQHLGTYFIAPVGVLLPNDIAVQPDFVLVLHTHKAIIRGGRIRGAPDLIIEVLSPGNTSYEMQTKKQTYAQAAVPEYAVINPRTRTLFYYRLESAGAYATEQLFTEDTTITFACLPTIPLSIASLFADAPDTTLRVQS